MTIRLIEALLLLEFILILCHSLYFLGRKNTFLFFGIGILYAFFREYHIAHYPLPFYSANSLLLFKIPLLITIGWVFHFYLAYWAVEVLLGSTIMKGGKRVLLVSFLVAEVMLVFALAAEPIGSRLGWWTWHKENLFHIYWFLETPLNVLGGWMLTGGLFALTYLVFLEGYGVRWFSLAALLISPYYFTLSGPFINIPVAVALLSGYLLFMAWRMRREDQGRSQNGQENLLPPEGSS